MKQRKLWTWAAVLLGMTIMGCQRQGGTNGTDAAHTDASTDYAGVYLDDDRTDNNLVITADSAGGYQVSIAIFRLASLDDGHGEATPDGLAFTAIDPSGLPISGIITFDADTAVVTFTDSHWEYLPNGEQVRYTKSSNDQSQEPDDQGEEAEDPVLTAINRYLTEAIANQYAEADVTIPSYDIIDSEATLDGDTVRVWGDFWVYRYNVVGDTLRFVSGGAHPGLLYLTNTADGYQVDYYDAVADGSDNVSSARRIFGSRYSAFHAVNPNLQHRDSLRISAAATYARRNGLSVKFLQDYGQPAIAIQ